MLLLSNFIGFRNMIIFFCLDISGGNAKETCKRFHKHRAIYSTTVGTYRDFKRARISLWWWYDMGDKSHGLWGRYTVTPQQLRHNEENLMICFAKGMKISSIRTRGWQVSEAGSYRVESLTICLGDMKTYDSGPALQPWEAKLKCGWRFVCSQESQRH